MNCFYSPVLYILPLSASLPTNSGQFASMQTTGACVTYCCGEFCFVTYQLRCCMVIVPQSIYRWVGIEYRHFPTVEDKWQYECKPPGHDRFLSNYLCLEPPHYIYGLLPFESQSQELSTNNYAVTFTWNFVIKWSTYHNQEQYTLQLAVSICHFAGSTGIKTSSWNCKHWENMH